MKTTKNALFFTKSKIQILNSKRSYFIIPQFRNKTGNVKLQQSHVYGVIQSEINNMMKDFEITVT